MPALANLMLQTLERIVKYKRESDLDSLLKAVLPKLTFFLSYDTTDVRSEEVKKTRYTRTQKKSKQNVEKLDAKNYYEDNCRIALNILAKVFYLTFYLVHLLLNFDYKRQYG